MESVVNIRSLEDGVQLEAQIFQPTSDVSNGHIGVVLAHPYGPLGGDMNNNVVSFLYKYFTQKNYTVVRFNSR